MKTQLESLLYGRTLTEAVRDFERTMLREALKQAQDEGKGVTRAAHLLGFAHHQSLIALLNARHRALRVELDIKTRKRRKPIVTKGSKHKSVQRRETK